MKSRLKGGKFCAAGASTSTPSVAKQSRPLGRILILNTNTIYVDRHHIQCSSSAPMQMAEARLRPCMAGASAPRPRACNDSGLAGRNTALQQRLRPAGRWQQQPGALRQQRRLGGSRLAASVVDGSQAQQQDQEQQAVGSGSSAAAVAAAATPPSPRCDLQQAASAHSQAEQQRRQGEGLVRKPEDFQLPQGQLSYVERCEPLSVEDVFRCTACTRPECQVRAPGRALPACPPRRGAGACPQRYQRCNERCKRSPKPRAPAI